MIFIQSTDERLFVFLTEKDIQTMRQGRTTFVDEHQLGAARFKGVIMGYANTDSDALGMLKAAGHKVDVETLTVDGKKGVVPEPKAGEGRCEGCDGIMGAGLLLGGRCIVCWSREAKKYRAMFS